MATAPEIILPYVRKPLPPERVYTPEPIVDYYTPPQTNGHLPPVSVTVQPPATFQFSGMQVIIGLLVLYLLLKK
jgi:hypothetical protein